MPAAPRLDDAQIAQRLSALPGWARDGDAIVKSFKTKDFTEAVAFVDRLVQPSNEMDHHPDVAIHWDTVTLRLWTHASGGITERDFRLASELEKRWGG